MSDYDVLVIGGGHNGLISAAYLAKAGYRVCVLEKQATVGGAVVTQEIVPGFRFDLGGSIISLINLTPIISELELAKYGYDPIFLDPMFFSPYPDGSHLMLWQDVERSCQSIAAVSPRDADAYRRFVCDWQPFLEVVIDAMHQTPAPLDLARTVGGGFLSRVPAPLKIMALLGKSISGLLDHYFSSQKLKAAIAWMSVQSGTGVDEPFGAMTAAWFITYHMVGMAHPRGGAGELTQSLLRMIRAQGGEVLTNAEVEEILIDQNRVAGVKIRGVGEISAKKVISAVHIRTTMELIAERAESSRKRIERLDLGNGMGMAVRLAVNELPDYSALPGKIGTQHTALQLIAPDMQYIRSAYNDYQAGRISTNPLLAAMTFSAVDPALAPSGKHTLYLWGQYFPYMLADGKQWEHVREQAAATMLNKLVEYAPNLRHAVIDQYIETPLDLERLFGMPRANITHLPMTMKHMFMFRPTSGLSQYRASIKGLYLSGASTHPGGGIMGLPGRNTARVVLEDLQFHR